MLCVGPLWPPPWIPPEDDEDKGDVCKGVNDVPAPDDEEEDTGGDEYNKPEATDKPGEV